MYKLALLPLFSTIFLLLSHPISTYANTTTEYWSSFNNKSTLKINHSAWDDFLQKYINTENDNKVSYSKVSKKDKTALDNYIKELSGVNPLSYTKAEQYAYWVNLYNSITIKLVVDHYPVSSIKKIKLGGGLFNSGPWKANVVTVNNKALSLDDIEHKILRPIWQNPLTHYAVNCASIGCPNLANRAFTAENTNTLLKQNAKRFINSNKGMKYTGNKITLSKIYSWFKEDFGTKQKNIFKHLKQYADEDRLKVLKSPQLNVNYYYNWDLNDNK